MKNFLTGILLVALIASCKKKDAATCEINMTSIAGRYKITKLEKVLYATGAAIDITSTLTRCERSGIYTFRPDSTAMYVEAINCMGTGRGTWYLSNQNLIISVHSPGNKLFYSTSIESWDCIHLVSMTQLPSVAYNYRYTLTKF